MIGDLFKAAGLRRRDRLQDLRVKHADLLVEHAAAVDVGDDDAAARVWLKVEKLDGEIRAAQAALDSAARQEQQRHAEAAQQQHKRLIAERDAALRALADEAARFDELISGEAAAQWGQVQAAAEVAQRACTAAGDLLAAHAGLVPLNVWHRVWRRFGQRVDLQVPQGATPSRPVPSVAETVAAYRIGTDSRNTTAPLAH